ncbi:response regulator [Reichenbachiella sp.]|uniref:hybrid sensor histidine kinase/response regulator transcription factor n=1 Tax=Reichenbachiella sp. TaxID=2184521 RepID=UPI003299634E
MKLRALFLYLLFLCPTDIFSQNAPLYFERIGVEDGLMSNRVLKSVEDNQGFIWMANETHVNRYDGRIVKNYKIDNDNTSNPSTNYVSVVLRKDAKGVIWLVYNNGLILYYDESLDRFKVHDHIRGQNNEYIHVSEFIIDSRGRFIVGSLQVVWIYDPVEKKAKKLLSTSSAAETIVENSENQFFVGSKEGIYVLNAEYQLLENLKEKEVSGHWLGKEQTVTKLLLQESENKLWIGTPSSGLFYYDLIRNKLSHNLINSLDVRIKSITEMKDGRLLVGTDGAGLFVYDPFKMEVVHHLLNDELDQGSLSSNAVYDVMVNSTGVVFISTYRGGVNIYNPYRQNFHSLRHKQGQKNSLMNDIVYSFSEPQKSVLSFGTEAGISLWNAKTNSWKNVSLSSQNNDNKSQVAWSQAIDNDGNLWVASFTHPIGKFNTDDFSKQQINYDFLEGQVVKRVYYHSNGDLLLATIYSGLYVLDNGGGVINYDIAEAFDFEAYSNEKVLISARHGLFFLDLLRKDVEQLNSGLIGDTLKNMAVVSAIIDRERNLHLGTKENGLLTFNTSLDQVRVIDQTSGLASNAVFDLRMDDEGDIWAATSLGISRINEQGIANFYSSDGLISTDFNENASFLSSDGKLFFGTSSGVIYFDPREIRTTEISKQLVLTDFYLNHEKIIAGSKGPLKKPINNTELIALPHDQNSFSIEFASIDFRHADQGNYAWKLEGFDENWIIGGVLNQATYTNLNPGDYVFRLKMQGRSSNQLAEERQLKIMINSPYWKTSWAFAIYSIVILLVLLSAIYLNRLKNESQRAEGQLHLLIDMAHEIKTPLTLIKAPLTDILSNNKVDDESRESVEVALSNADKLLKQMRQFLDFKGTSVHKDNLRLEPINLLEFIREKIFAFQILAERKRISIKLETKIERLDVNTDVKILDKIISNLLSNAIKYTLQDGTVTIILESFPDQWTLSIEDTGIGIPLAEQKKVFKLFYRTKKARDSGVKGSGVGLVLAKDLASTLGGNLELTSSSHTGSKFKVSIPIVKPDQSNAKVNGLEDLEEDSLTNEQAGEGKLTILLAEDNDDLREYETSRLIKQGYQVIPAPNGQAALEILEENQPDLVISDVMMPKMNGRQLCLNIKSNIKTSHIPVILLTGQESKEHVMQGFESGADDYIVKPFDFDVLNSKIEGLINSRSLLKEKFLGLNNDEYQWTEISSQLDQEFVEQATTHVEENLSDSEYSVDGLCASMGMSRTTFYHKIKSLIDISPADFIRAIRLKEAKKLLLHPNYNISEVAYQTGFADAKYFSTVFKKNFGESPSAFASKNQPIESSSESI